MKKIRYAIEAVLLHLIFVIFKLMPVDMASGCGGFLGRAIGPRMAASRKALNNIRETLPDIDDAQAQNILSGMWDNLGRVIAEYPHFKKISMERVTIENEELTTELFKKDGPAIFIGAHFGNWEIAVPFFFYRYDKKCDITYRALNNPWNEKLLARIRTLGGKLNAYPKARESSQKILQAMKNGHNLGILIDQKYNEGLAVPFFGRPAMTNPVFAQLALKYKCPLVPIQVERTKGANFVIRLYDPVDISDKDVTGVIESSHAVIEKWIANKPEQWLWLHRRWSERAEKLYREAA